MCTLNGEKNDFLNSVIFKILRKTGNPINNLLKKIICLRGDHGGYSPRTPKEN